nr:hypothetical protein [Tanacetum cinerariifolium]
MATTIEQQESTLQVVYDVLRMSPFFKAFLVTADVPEIYMQEFWATATVHQHSIKFKMDTRKHIVDLEAFREMLHISPRVPGQSFAELPFEEDILEFLRFLGHSAQIKTLTDVNVNKLYQPWRSFAVVINKCLTGKSTGFDNLRLSQAQILWGLYHRRNVDYAFLIWEDLVYQVEHKNQKKSNEMYYPRFTKVIIHHFMTKKPSIPRRNRVNWHYVRDDILFSTIKVNIVDLESFREMLHISPRIPGQSFAELPFEEEILEFLRFLGHSAQIKTLTDVNVNKLYQPWRSFAAVINKCLTGKSTGFDSLRNTKAYKEYYACATGEAAPKPKASARKKKGTGSKPRVPNVPSDDSEEEISWNSFDDEDEDQGLKISEEERMHEE